MQGLCGREPATAGSKYNSGLARPERAGKASEAWAMFAAAVRLALGPDHPLTKEAERASE